MQHQNNYKNIVRQPAKSTLNKMGLHPQQEPLNMIVGSAIFLSSLVLLAIRKVISDKIKKHKWRRYQPIADRGYIDSETVYKKNRNDILLPMKVPLIPRVKRDSEAKTITICPASFQKTSADAMADLKFFEEFFRVKISEIEKVEVGLRLFGKLFFPKSALRIYEDTLDRQVLLKEIIPQKSAEYEFVFGERNHDNNKIVSASMANNSSLILYGQMGSGKTITLKTLVLQALRANPKTRVIIVSGTKVQGDFHEFLPVAEVIDADSNDGFERLVEIASELKAEVKTRVDSYKTLAPHQHHVRFTAGKYAPVVLVLDEARQYLNSNMAGSNKEKKKQIEQLVSFVTFAITQGRSSGLIVLTALQEPQKNSIDINTYLFNIKICSNSENDDVAIIVQFADR